MKKVFASDFDGTLYFNHAKVKLPPESVQAIIKYQEAGNLFGLCTGRQLNAITPLTAGHFVPDFYITSSGASIRDKDLNVIAAHGLSRQTAASIVNEFHLKKIIS